MKKKKSQKGFTLIELIIVIAILGILATVLLPKFTGFTDKARGATAMADAKNLATAVEALMAEGKKPNATAGTAVSAANSKSFKDIDVMHYVGKNLNGDLNLVATAVAAAGSTGAKSVGDFTYIKEVDGKYYTVTYHTDTGKFDDVVASDTAPTGYALTKY
ncbi:type II secretion system GspH family protein [Crassaminicella profunda]|nr:type II secretion system GspH family protein [Crassaminicella profunda]